MARRKYKWNFAAYGDPKKNAVTREAFNAGAELKHGDKCYMLRRLDDPYRCEVSEGVFYRRTLTGAYVTFDESNIKYPYFITYHKGWMVFDSERKAQTALAVHSLNLHSSLKVRADAWHESFQKSLARAVDLEKRENNSWG